MDSNQDQIEEIKSNEVLEKKSCWIVVLHKHDHAEGEVFFHYESARDYYNSIHIKWAKRLYDQDLRIISGHHFLTSPEVLDQLDQFAKHQIEKLS